MRLLVATTNPHKLAEIRRLLPGAALTCLRDLPPVDEPEETGATFEENARLKARYYARRTGLVTVAEDSGLGVDALGGEPGVLSARYLSPDATYDERFASILGRLAERPDEPRTARFVCAVAIADGDRIVFETTGTIEGEIARAPAGDQGFGYDPIFYYPPYAATLGQVSAERKLEVAHRGKAFRAVAGWLQRQP